MLGALLGGIGLFILAIGMMTEGLKLAAGSALRRLLGSWSQTPLRGIFTGFIMTAIVQSSSAVTVASLGFVNAGLIKMRQALGIIYGANVGTTITGWLVAIIGFKLNIQAIALPMIGIGMIAKLATPNTRFSAFGWALVGFGLFFVGIDVLKTSFETVVNTFDISQYTADGLRGIFLYLVMGILMTVLTQSSSASIALTITAASSGIIDLYAAGAMVIGANVGTTSTAVFAAIGATSNAKRVACAQVIFNLATALVALIILPIIFSVINGLCHYLAITQDSAISLALFHTVFNLLGVALFYPFSHHLAIFLEKRFQTYTELASRPQYIDKTLAATPAIAVNALVLEAQAFATRVSKLFQQAALRTSPSPRIYSNEIEALKKLSQRISHYVVTIENTALPDDIRQQLTLLLRIEQYLATCALLCERLDMELNAITRGLPSPTKQWLADYLAQNEAIICQELPLSIPESQFQQSVATCQFKHDEFKEQLLVAGTLKEITIHQMSGLLDVIHTTLRFTQNWHKAVHRLSNLSGQLSTPNPQ